MNQMETLLQQKYAFDVFAKDSINFGIMVTYRQTWKPERYQVGDLVSTIPLAPREIRRYTTRRVTQEDARREGTRGRRCARTRSESTARRGSSARSSRRRRTRPTSTSRRTRSFGGEDGYKIDSRSTAAASRRKQSEKAKKDFRESVLKSAAGVQAAALAWRSTPTPSEETEDTTFHEIQNPNDELDRHLPVLRAAAHVPDQREASTSSRRSSSSRTTCRRRTRSTTPG